MIKASFPTLIAFCLVSCLLSCSKVPWLSIGLEVVLMRLNAMLITAILDIISGNYEPSGLLPFPMPINDERVKKYK